MAARGHHAVATTETTAQADALVSAHPELTVRKLDVTDAGDIVQVADIDLEKLVGR